MAQEQGLRFIALTDHDTCAGVAEAQQAAAGTALRVIPGVEISSEGGWGELHFLGFHVDCTDISLNRALEAMRTARLGRARQMVERLADLGMRLEWGEVQALAGGESVGRPHIARALFERGYVSSPREAFERYIGRDGPAYVPRMRLTPQEVIGLIRGAGGIAVLAHPAYSGLVDRIEEFASWGLQGLEVYYPHHSHEDLQTLLRLCWRLGLLATGGSDFHGPDHEEGGPMGSVYVPIQCALRLQEQALANAKVYAR